MQPGRDAPAIECPCFYAHDHQGRQRFHSAGKPWRPDVEALLLKGGASPSNLFGQQGLDFFKGIFIRTADHPDDLLAFVFRGGGGLRLGVDA